MITELVLKKKYDIRFLKVSAGSRYPEDFIINGESVKSFDYIPCFKDGYWNLFIDIETGKINNWPKGVTAEVHSKVCDNGSYILIDINGKEITEIEGYVVNCMCPKSEGYGDYIIMDIDKEGKIKDWKPDFRDFSLPIED